MLAVEQAAAGELHVDEADHGAAIQVLGKPLQRRQAIGDIGGANQRADGGAAHDVRLDAGFLKRLDDADMGPAARRATAERQADAPTAG